MPRGDGTGPVGMGPMTGRAAGYCVGYSASGYVNPVTNGIYSGVNPIRAVGWAGFGYGRRWGRGRGWGRGSGWRGGFFPGYGYGYSDVPEMTYQQQAEILKEQAKVLQESISSINERIKELESAKNPEQE
ncbi:MAG: DUF5320 domain-containing protein [Candidatus Omnitrophica bacterium]|nr:DUF5320 domain-containing protein [Candidatus Omnitrophota bacterium]